MNWKVYARQHGTRNTYAPMVTRLKKLPQNWIPVQTIEMSMGLIKGIIPTQEVPKKEGIEDTPGRFCKKNTHRLMGNVELHEAEWKALSEDWEKTGSATVWIRWWSERWYRH